jgi:hypothetical protein
MIVVSGAFNTDGSDGREMDVRIPHEKSPW